MGKIVTLASTVSIRLCRAEKKCLAKLARMQRLSGAQIIRRALEAYARSALTIDEYRTFYPPEPAVQNANGARTEGKCKCGAPGLPLHSCPYDADVHNDKTPTCNCCKACQDDCAREV